MSINVNQYKKDCKSKGIDLYDDSGDGHGDGFVENKGNNFKVFTYHDPTSEQLDILKDMAWKNKRK